MKPTLMSALAAKKKSTCPACMAAGGKCMAHGGSVESYEDTDGKAHEALVDEGNKHKYAEGGEVDDEAPLRMKSAMPGDSEEEHPDREDSTGIPEETPTQESYSDSEEDLPKISESLSLAAEIMKDRKLRKFAKGGSVPVEPDYSSTGVGQLHGDMDPTDEMYESNNADEKDAPLEDGRPERGLSLSSAKVMTDPEHDTSDASLVAEILKDRKNRRRG